MTVYVDDMHLYSMGEFGRMKMSHMMADTRAELLEMVDHIGVPRWWLQKEGELDEHFDISKSKRSAALQAGARAVSIRELARFAMNRDMDAYINGSSPGIISTSAPTLFP